MWTIYTIFSSTCVEFDQNYYFSVNFGCSDAVGLIDLDSCMFWRQISKSASRYQIQDEFIDMKCTDVIPLINVPANSATMCPTMCFYFATTVN